MKNNKGFSFVEVIIVIAILAIVSGGAIVSFRSITNARVLKCAREIDAKLSSCRLDNMSMEKRTYLIIHRGTDGAYYLRTAESPGVDLSTDKGEKIGSKVLSISTMGASPVLLNGTNRIVLSYKKGTGALEIPAGYGDFESIIVSESGRKCTITFAKLTGKHTLKQE